MKSKSYIRISICGILFVLLSVASVVYYVDPYFQYHVPNEQLVYNMEMNSFSYYNAGIAKNFSYDTVVTGSSMSRAMLPSYIDEKFICQTVKLSMAEARGKDYEILFSILDDNSNLERVIMGLDTFAFNVDKDYSSYEKPMHMYDDNPLNDVLYLVNMDGLLESHKVLSNTKNDGKTTTMDDYQNYTLTNTFSSEKVMEIYNDKAPVVRNSEVDKDALNKTVIENLEQNLIPTIANNPQVKFLFYFPPYSIVKWGIMENRAAEIECMRIMIEKLIDYPNVSIYFYQGEQSVITDLEHYMDTIHFDTFVANGIVDYMTNDDNILTRENYEHVLAEFSAFIQNYNYSALEY